MAEMREQIDFVIGHNAAEVSAFDQLQLQLSRQEALLRDMAQTLGWIRAMLTPVRSLWLRLRGKR
jgi:hypothetical protein